MATALRVRAGQREFERGLDRHRICAFLTRRQYGKTTTAARIALKKMMRAAGHDVVFGSVKLDLGREIVRKEAALLQKLFASLSADAAKAKCKLDVLDSDKHQSVAGVSADDFAELYETSRLEFRLYHSATVFSRTKVVALTPDAVGETGDLILDEVGRVKRFREVWEAVKPIISSNPTFRCLLTTTPPPDDTHYSFELLAYPLGAQWTVNKSGTWYRSDLGVWVLRVDAWDAAADGVPLYDDDTGEPITPEQSRAKDPDKDAWDRNYGVKFVIGGTAACGLIELDSAQRRGLGQCACVVVETDADFDRALDFLAKHLGDGAVGCGWDLATTEKEGSNPSSFTVTEARGLDEIQRLVCLWKSSDPDLQCERAERILQTIAAREKGGRARRLAIDATNERLFARGAQKWLARHVPVELVIASETVRVPGNDTPVTKKTWLGDLYVGQLNDNRLWLPPERYVREDHRLTRKVKGQYTCEAAPDGKHGDTFDSGKLASHALRTKGIARALALATGEFEGGTA